MARKPATRKATSVALPEVLDIKAAAPLAEQLLTLRGGPVKVDASKVTRLGGQCLQVLLSAAATWKVDDTPFDLDTPSDAFLSGLELLGLSPEHISDKGSLA